MWLSQLYKISVKEEISYLKSSGNGVVAKWIADNLKDVCNQVFDHCILMRLFFDRLDHFINYADS